jgi:hypothetical protein
LIPRQICSSEPITKYDSIKNELGSNLPFF